MPAKSGGNPANFQSFVAGVAVLAYSSFRPFALALLAAGAPALTAFAQEAPTNFDRLEVQSESDDILVQDGYVAKQDRIGTKVDTPIVEIPQAISVVTQDQIEDQKPRTLNETLSYTASANPNGFGFDSRYDAFTLRGFPAYYNGIFRDGLRQYNGPSAWFKTEPYGIEGLTVLKGPASSLYGISGPGGIVNLVTKRPKDEQFREVELLFGEDNRYQTAFDFSGPANEDGTLLYRMTGLGRMSDTDLPGYPDDKLYFAPAMTWKPDEDTKLTVLGELRARSPAARLSSTTPPMVRCPTSTRATRTGTISKASGPHRLRVRAPLQRHADGSPEPAFRRRRRRSGV